VPQLAEVAQPYLDQIDRAQGKPVERARGVLLNALAQLPLREDTRTATGTLLREMFAQLTTSIARRSRRSFRSLSSARSCTPSRIICRRASMNPPC